MLLLNGCSTTASDFKACKIAAPDIVVYSKEMQRATAQEMLSGKTPNMAQMIVDYVVMRYQTRLLLKAK